MIERERFLLTKLDVVTDQCNGNLAAEILAAYDNGEGVLFHIWLDTTWSLRDRLREITADREDGPLELRVRRCGTKCDPSTLLWLVPLKRFEKLLKERGGF